MLGTGGFLLGHADQLSATAMSMLPAAIAYPLCAVQLKQQQSTIMTLF